MKVKRHTLLFGMNFGKAVPLPAADCRQKASLPPPKGENSPFRKRKNS